MISVVIRNKNESKALSKVLPILTTLYADDIGEVILVDNKSEDDSVKVAKKYGCRVVNIDNFTYGKATNLGISEAKYKYVLLLSAHAIPIGNAFFKSAIQCFEHDSKVAGVRFVNTFDNYVRAFKNNYIVKEPLKYGLMTACGIINKMVWENYKFDEILPFSEDKAWSKTVIDNGFFIKDVAEAFYYFPKRNKTSNLNRFKQETIAHYKLHNLKYPSKLKLTLILIKRIILDLPQLFFNKVIDEIKIYIVKLKINKVL